MRAARRQQSTASCKGHRVSLSFLRIRWYRTYYAASCSPPASTARGATRTSRRAHPLLHKPRRRRRGRPRRTAAAARRTRFQSAPRPSPPRVSLRWASSRPRSGGETASRAKPRRRPAFDPGSASRRAGRRGSGRRASPSPARRAAASSRICPRVRATATVTVTAQVPPQGRQEDLRQPTPDAHQGPGFTVSKTSKTPPTPQYPTGRGKLL